MRSLRTLVRLACLAAVAWAALGGAVCAQPSRSNPMDEIAGTALPSNAEGAVSSARKRVAAGDLPAAIRELSVYVAAHPRELEPARYLGDLYYRAADVASAEKTYRAILVFAPGDRETHNRLGGIYAAQDRISEAIEQFQKSLPSDSAYGHLVDLHRRLGDLDRFEAGFWRAAENAPMDPAAQYALGAVLHGERKTAQAAIYLQRALELSPESCATLSELGSTYLDLNRVGAAIDMLQRCLNHSPDDYAALVNIGDAYIEGRRYDLARNALQHANRIRPDGSEALVDLGYLQDVSQNWQDAVTLYLKAIGVDPLARDAYVDLGYDYDEHKLFALAEAAFLKGLSVSPGDGRLHYLLGVTYADQGKLDLARAEYRRALTSDDPEVAHAANRDLATLQ